MWIVKILYAIFMAGSELKRINHELFFITWKSDIESINDSIIELNERFLFYWQRNRLIELSDLLSYVDIDELEED